MSNPVLVEVLRGDLVESRHEGSVAVFDDAGKSRTVDSAMSSSRCSRARRSRRSRPCRWSRAARPITMASATGNWRWPAPRIRASRSMSRLATGMLAKASLDGSALECGAHWPSNQEATVALARAGGMPSALHNNCSGKHSGFLCGCRHLRHQSSGLCRRRPSLPGDGAPRRWPRLPAPSMASAIAAPMAARSPPTRCR